MAPRKFVSEFILEIAPVTVTGSLITVSAPAKKVKAAAFKSICPTHGHEAPTVIKQQLVCSEDSSHGPFTSDDVLKAKETEKGTLVPVAKEDVEAAKKSDLPDNFLSLNVYDAAQVEASTYPSGNAYIFYPKVASGAYGVIADILAEPDLAFIGVCNLKNNEKLLRLQRWGDLVVVQQLLYPEELNERERTAIDYKGEFLEMMLQFIEPKPFDAEAYKNERTARVAALTAGVQGVAVTPKAKSKKSDEDEAMDALRDALAQRKKTA